MYYSVVLILAIGLVTVATVSVDDCMELNHPHSKHCCKEIPFAKDKMMDDFKECLPEGERKPPPPHNCDVDECIAKKHGLLTADGTIDKKAMEADVEKRFESDPELAEALKTNCVNKDLTKFGPPDMCELAKIRHCIMMHLLMECQNWDDKGHCSGIKQLAEECKSIV